MDTLRNTLSRLSTEKNPSASNAKIAQRTKRMISIIERFTHTKSRSRIAARPHAAQRQLVGADFFGPHLAFNSSLAHD